MYTSICICMYIYMCIPTHVVLSIFLSITCSFMLSTIFLGTKQTRAGMSVFVLTHVCEYFSEHHCPRMRCRYFSTLQIFLQAHREILWITENTRVLHEV